ncbi:MAG TPA: archease [Acidobacteriota bacterium]|nr:archease [Acidobacteriota bacterium]
MPYHYVDEYTVADIAFEANGATLEEVFRSAAEAVMNAMIENLDEIRPEVTREVELEDSALDLLLFRFLQEFVYFKDADYLVLRVNEIQIEKASEVYRLRARLVGETLDADRHEQRVDVKAITLHEFCLEQVHGGWRAQVLLDV